MVMDPSWCIPPLHVPPKLTTVIDVMTNIILAGQVQEDESLFEDGTGEGSLLPHPGSPHRGARGRGRARGRLPLLYS